MDVNSGHILPIQGLEVGVHQFRYHFDSTFFDQFESNLVHGDFDILLTVEKQATMLDLKIQFEGHEATACDRCLANIRIPVTGEARLILKFDDEPRIEGGIVFLPHGTPFFDAGPFIYESIAVALPLVKRFDCERLSPKPCNTDVLKHLNETQNAAPSADVWAELKKLKNHGTS